MRSLLERHIAGIEDRLVVLAPPSRPIPATFLNVQPDEQRRARLIAELQRLRGSVYLEDGAVAALSEDGRHRTPEDEHSWHFLRVDQHQRVSACLWYREQDRPTSIEDLRVRDCPLLEHDDWRDHLHQAVKSELLGARLSQVPYAEIGGWAVSKKDRCSVEGIILALSAFSLGRMFGGALGIATATARNASAKILRRLGGARLEWAGVEVPAYYDPRYNCEMEILRFNSRRADPRYDHLVEALTASLSNVAVFVSDAAQASLESVAPAAA